MRGRPEGRPRDQDLFGARQAPTPDEGAHPPVVSGSVIGASFEEAMGEVRFAWRPPAVPMVCIMAVLTIADVLARLPPSGTVDQPE